MPGGAQVAFTPLTTPDKLAPVGGQNTGETEINKDDVQDVINFAIKAENSNLNSNRVTIHGDVPTNGKIKIILINR